MVEFQFSIWLAILSKVACDRCRAASVGGGIFLSRRRVAHKFGPFEATRFLCVCVRSNSPTEQPSNHRCESKRGEIAIDCVRVHVYVCVCVSGFFGHSILWCVARIFVVVVVWLCGCGISVVFADMVC